MLSTFARCRSCRHRYDIDRPR